MIIGNRGNGRLEYISNSKLEMVLLQAIKNRG